MTEQADLLPLVGDITIAYVANNSIAAAELPKLIGGVHAALAALGSPAAMTAPEQAAPEPAVSLRKSLADPNFIVSMIDGKKYRLLRRHLSAHGLTPTEYRQRFGLPADYPLVAKAYTIARRELAKTIGLGRKAADAVADAVEAVESKVEQAVAPKRGRARKTFGLAFAEKPVEDVAG